MKNKYLFLQVICSILFTSTFYGQERITSNLNHPRMNWWKEAIFDIDRGKVYELQGCYLGEPWKWKNMKQEHQLFYFKDSEWKSILSCSTNGSGFSEFFSPITTRKLRLILVNEKEPPAARELLFFFIFDTTKIQKYKLTNIHFGAAVSNIKKISGIFY